MHQSIGWPKINRLAKLKSKENIYSYFHSLRHCPKRLGHIFPPTQLITYKFQSIDQYK